MNTRLNTFLFSLLFFSSACNSVEPKNQVIETNDGKHVALVLPEIPSELTFFNDKVKLEDEDLRERLDREILSFTYQPANTILLLKRANRYFPKIESVLTKNKVPQDFKYLCAIESNLQQAISPAGACGMWQLMIPTARQYGLIVNAEVDERFHLEKSTQCACDFILWARRFSNNWIAACASYNRGLDGVHNDMEEQYVTHYFDAELNNETARYVFRIMAFKLICENPQEYGFNIPKSQLYQPFQTTKFKVKSTIPDLKKWAVNKGINYKILKKLNPWLMGDKLTLNPKNYTIELPKENTKLKNYNEYF